MSVPRRRVSLGRHRRRGGEALARSLGLQTPRGLHLGPHSSARWNQPRGDEPHSSGAVAASTRPPSSLVRSRCGGREESGCGKRMDQGRHRSQRRCIGERTSRGVLYRQCSPNFGMNGLHICPHAACARPAARNPARPVCDSLRAEATHVESPSSPSCRSPVSPATSSPGIRRDLESVPSAIPIASAALRRRRRTNNRLAACSPPLFKRRFRKKGRRESRLSRYPCARSLASDGPADCRVSHP